MVDGNCSYEEILPESNEVVVFEDFHGVNNYYGYRVRRLPCGSRIGPGAIPLVRGGRRPTISFLLTSRNIRAGRSDQAKCSVNRLTVVFCIRLDLRDALFALCLIKGKTRSRSVLR